MEKSSQSLNTDQGKPDMFPETFGLDKFAMPIIRAVLSQSSIQGNSDQTMRGLKASFPA
jgi:hypothetical protein